jgi:hypothetical protein
MLRKFPFIMLYNENIMWGVISPLLNKLNCVGYTHKVLTYIEYGAVSDVFRIIDHSPPLHLASVSSLRTKGGWVHTRRAVRGWAVNSSEDARHCIDLLQYNPSTDILQADNINFSLGKTRQFSLGNIRIFLLKLSVQCTVYDVRKDYSPYDSLKTTSFCLFVKRSSPE